MTRATCRVFAIQSTETCSHGPGRFYRKRTGSGPRAANVWGLLEHATTFDNYARAVKAQTTLDISRGVKCTRIVELELTLAVRDGKGAHHGNA